MLVTGESKVLSLFLPYQVTDSSVPLSPGLALRQVNLLSPTLEFAPILVYPNVRSSPTTGYTALSSHAWSIVIVSKLFSM